MKILIPGVCDSYISTYTHMLNLEKKKHKNVYKHRFHIHTAVHVIMYIRLYTTSVHVDLL